MISAKSSVLAILLLFGLGCGGEREAEERATEAPATPSRPLSVYVVNYPLAYFAERIGGDQVRVELPAPPDVDPAYWRPEAEAIAKYQGADLILLNGAGYAGWIELASLPQSRLVDTSVAFVDQLIPLESGPVHSHGPQGEHTHTGFAFTTWLDPTLAARQAVAVAEALSEARPEEAEAFRLALEELEADLGELDKRSSAVWSQLSDQPVLFSHPVYQYVERRYSLNGRSLHWEPEEAPSEDGWRELETLVEGHPARWMIWEDEPLAATRERLEGMGIGVLLLRSAANEPVAGDLVTNMEDDLASIQAALGV